MRTFVAFTSGGNDSVAMMQLIIEERIHQTDRMVAIYTNTGWAAPYWEERISRMRTWVVSQGVLFAEIRSQGFETLCRSMTMRKGEPSGGFPSGREKFCTRWLKIKPSLDWLSENDEEKQFICCVGVRRAESERRRHTPVFIPSSPNHGGRALWHPLAEFSDKDRDALVLRTPMELLDHRSDECEPCIFSSRKDLRRVRPEKVATIRQMEQDTGKVMFRPAAYAGASGIDEVMRWAWSERGQYKPDEGEELIVDCETDFCGL